MKLIKSTSELQLMREGGERLAKIRDRLLEELKVRAVPLQIDNLAKKLITEADAIPSFMTVNNYQWATCININDMVVHGIPTQVPLEEGDVVGLDVGLIYKGYHTDTSWSAEVKSQSIRQAQDEKSKVKSEIETFLKIGEEALNKAIKQARPGNRIGHISKAIQETVESAGYSVVRSLVGHGVGKTLHEPPQVPGILTKPLDKTPELVPGMVLAIEVIYNMGGEQIVYKNEDGWTLVTADGSISGLFEHTVEIGKNSPIVLT